MVQQNLKKRKKPPRGGFLHEFSELFGAEGGARLHVLPGEDIFVEHEVGVGAVLLGDGDGAAVDVQAVFALLEGGNVEVPAHEHVVFGKMRVFVVPVR